MGSLNENRENDLLSFSFRSNVPKDFATTSFTDRRTNNLTTVTFCRYEIVVGSSSLIIGEVRTLEQSSGASPTR